MEIDYIPEPMLSFGHEQELDSPKDGLFLFGPASCASRPSQIRAAVVGTKSGLGLFKNWVSAIGRKVGSEKAGAQYVYFPGFEAVFGASWSPEPVYKSIIDPVKIENATRIKERHIRVYDTVSLYENAVRSALLEDSPDVSIWFIIIPDVVHRFCRPQSSVPGSEAIFSPGQMNFRTAKKFIGNQPSLFGDVNKEAEKFSYDVDFHHQLKSRLLSSGVVVQIVRESTLLAGANTHAIDVRSNVQSADMIAWNLATTAYFKADGLPWKLSSVREGVCYIGLVFKETLTPDDTANACCGAQLFLDSGDGMVFKLAKGKFNTYRRGEFHLDKKQATELIELIIETYKVKCGGDAPKEIFIHGKTRFNREEIEGFKAACPVDTKIAGVRISPFSDIKVFRPQEMPVVRGTILIHDDNKGSVWTKGYIPRLRTYPGREVPNPLSIERVFGDTELKVIMKDVLALTKVNFNSCIYSDGLPVTLRFADAVGEILTATPVMPEKPLPFKHYI